ncbi:MAG: molybdopterin-guanine dinucleotide biosynthesis protein B [Dehalococcoidia bacterium]
MVPVVTVVGNSNSGKTTVAAELIDTLNRAGYRVGAIKHCPHGHESDRTGSDTHRFYQAGAVAVVAASPDKHTLTGRSDGDPHLESILPSLGNDLDLVIAEGFKGSPTPKILVLDHQQPPAPLQNLLATVGHSPYTPEVPHYYDDQLEDLAARIRRQFLSPAASPPPVSLTVNGLPIPLSSYPTSALSGIVEGFLSSLKGIPAEINEVQMTLRKPGT